MADTSIAIDSVFSVISTEIAFRSSLPRDCQSKEMLWLLSSSENTRAVLPFSPETSNVPESVLSLSVSAASATEPVELICVDSALITGSSMLPSVYPLPTVMDMGMFIEEPGRMTS